MTKKHVWLMLIGCLVPIVGLATIYLFNVPVSTVLLVGLASFCPLSYLLMMKFMPHDPAEHIAASQPNPLSKKPSS